MKMGMFDEMKIMSAVNTYSSTLDMLKSHLQRERNYRPRDDLVDVFHILRKFAGHLCSRNGRSQEATRAGLCQTCPPIRNPSRFVAILKNQMSTTRNCRLLCRSTSLDIGVLKCAAVLREALYPCSSLYTRYTVPGRDLKQMSSHLLTNYALACGKEAPNNLLYFRIHVLLWRTIVETRLLRTGSVFFGGHNQYSFPQISYTL